MQPITRERKPKMLPPRLRLLLGLLISIIPFLVIIGAVLIPFYFESASILYKFGHDRLLLRSGQVMGLLAGCLLMLQIFLSARLKCLDRIFGLSNLFMFHRVTGIVIAGLVITHPILIFIPENRVTIPFQLRYWPEFVGLFLVLLIFAVVTSSLWRAWMRLAFHRWWPIHRSAAILITAAFWIHVLSVSDTFEQKLPRMIAFCAIGICGLLFLWIRIRPLGNQRKSLMVTAIEQAAEDAVGLRIISETKNMPAYLPGQFSFIKILSPHIPREEHPFTIASTPTAPSFLEFIVRTAGDWTAKLKDLQPGDKVVMNGPFGFFSHLRLAEKKEIIMIAGGIGVTPMLSMLRYMADHNDQRKITLIWSNKTRNHIIFPQEFRYLEDQLKDLRIFHVLTRDPEFTGEKGHLDRVKLNRLISDCSVSSAVFVCGPDPMMKDVYKTLVSLGFPRHMIFMERFSL